MAQDRLFVIDKFSGLDLYSEKTKLEIGSALYTQNIQFRKPGTISVIDGLTLRDSLAGNSPFLGMGWIDDRVTDTMRMMFARDSILYYGRQKVFDLLMVFGEVSDLVEMWRQWNDSTRIEDTTYRGRAAEFYRPGWWWRAQSPSFTRSIKYISDNNTFFLTDTAGASTSMIDPQVHPNLHSRQSPVRFVPIDVSGRAMFVILQAGMEPLLSDGTTYGTRYFGVADTGIVQACRLGATSGVAYIVDNSMIGIYGDNEIPDLGYWLHTPYAYGDSDSSHWGRTWVIDSNVVVDTANKTEFRIYFTVGDTVFQAPGGAWLDSLRGSRYQLLSAPFLRDVVTNDSSPAARVKNGGRYLEMPTGFITPRVYDQMPHVLSLTGDADTLTTVQIDTIQTGCHAEPLCAPDPTSGRPGCPGFKWVCDTVYEPVRLAARQSQSYGYPIRTVFNDTVGTDSTVIWTSGENQARTTSAFNTEEWYIQRATIPFASDGIVYKDHLFLAGDPQDPNFIAYSDFNGERLSIGGFPIENVIHLPANGDVFVGFALIYDWLLIFQEEHVWVLKGVPPDATLELALPDEGALSLRSIIALENQVIYESHKGWRIYDGNTAKDFALAIKPAIQALPRVSYRVNQNFKHKATAAYNPTTGNVWMSMPFGSDTSNSGSFIYNYVDGSFTYSNEVYGDCVAVLPFLDSLHTFFTYKGKVFTYGYQDSLNVTGVDRDSMQSSWSSGWMDMGDESRYKKLGEGSVDVALSSPATGIGNTRFYVKMYRDFDSTTFYVDTTNVVGIVGGKHYEVETSVRLEPPADSTGTLQYLRVEFQGSGLNLLDLRRFCLRYGLGDDVIRDATKAIRP